MNLSSVRKIEVLAQIIEMKRIYSVIENSLLKSNPACLVVTSGAPGEGKTTIVAGLAAIAARRSNNRVLAVDLHWHAPALHSCFGLEPTFDLDNFRREKSIAGMVISSGISKLDILTARQSAQNEAESDRDMFALATEIMNQAGKAYNFVVVDTPSIFPTNRRMIDPVTMSKTADGVVLVALANVTPRQQLKRAHMFLETAGANVLGVIVNQWKNPIV
jgi:Mrp family chromosome partitioning ATPase